VHSDKKQLRLISGGRAAAGVALAVIVIVSLFSLFELAMHLLRSDLKSFLGEQSPGTILFATVVSILGVAVALVRERRIRLRLADEVEKRRRTLERLEISECHYRTLFKSNLVGVLRTSLDGTVLESNDALAHLMRFESSEQLVGANFHTFCTNEGFEQVLQRLQEDAGAMVNAEVAVRCFDGAPIWLLLNASLVQNTTGDPEIEITNLDITDRKNAEEALHKSERQYRILFENNSHPMWVFDIETLQFLDVNEAAIRHYGYTREEFLGMKASDIRPPEDIPAFLHEVSMLYAGFNDSRLWRHCRKDGSIRLVEITGFYIAVEGRPAELVSVNDVTQRELAQDQLRQSQAQMHAILSSAMDGIITLDSDQNIVLFNLAAEKIFGYSASEVIGTPIDRFVPEQLRSKHSAGFDEFSQSAQHSRFGMFTGMRADGRQFPIEASISQIEVSSEKLYTIILRDITKRRLAEERRQQLQSAITKAASEWRFTFDAVTSAILVLDMEGKIKRLNRAAKELIMAQHYEDALGRPILDFATCEPWLGVAKLVPNVVERRSPVSCQVREERGRTWDVVARVAANEGTEDTVVVVVRDATQIIQLQDSLRRSEAMASIGVLVAGVAHEVRNPLFGISSTVDTFEACFGDRREFQEYISILRDEVERLRKLMQELLEYGRPPTDELCAGSVNEVIESAVRACYFAAKQAEVTVKTAPGNTLPLVLMSSPRLMLLFRNLIENAIQHSPKGSEVLVETQLAGDKSAVACSVADSGPGFREQDLSRVFEPFFSRRRGGTGLGLSIVQRIIDEHGGSVRAGNRADGGALVQVALPVSQNVANEGDGAKE
jgi:PAS domain S-box-containing protein